MGRPQPPYGDRTSNGRTKFGIPDVEAHRGRGRREAAPFPEDGEDGAAHFASGVEEGPVRRGGGGSAGRYCSTTGSVAPRRRRRVAVLSEGAFA